MNLTLLIARGLPASGKTTLARAWVAKDRARRARVNRDDLRAMIDDGEFIPGVTEPRIVAARDAVILAFLGKGVSVVCDETCLPQRKARDLASLARRAGAVLEVADLTDVPLETCLERNAARTGRARIPEEAIRDMHTRYLKGQRFPLPFPEEPAGAEVTVALYEPKPGTPKAVLCDIDGTVALMAARSPFDQSRVHEDRPSDPVVRVLRAMHASGHQVVFLSGRTAGCEAATRMWLNQHVRVPFAGLHMRAEGDFRKDAIVKRELFDQHVREQYDVTCVLDDRDQVVQAWREKGLPCWQVAPGNF